VVSGDGDRGNGRGLGRRNGGVLVVELGHVADVFREDEMRKMVNQIVVRVHLSVPAFTSHD